MPLHAIETGAIGILKGVDVLVSGFFPSKAITGASPGGSGGAVDAMGNPSMIPDAAFALPGSRPGDVMGPPPPRAPVDAESEGFAPFTTGSLTGGATIQRVMAAMAAGGRGMRLGAGGQGSGGGVFNGVPAAPLAPGQASSNAQYAYNFFRDHDYTHEQATGIVAGNIGESGMRTDADGDNHRSGGIGQWNGTRRENFRKMFGHDVREGTLQEQLEFEQWELTHTHKAAGDAIRRSNTFAGSTDAHTRLLEIPANPDRDSSIRLGIARANERGFRQGYEGHMPGDQHMPGDDMAVGGATGGPRLQRASYESGWPPIEFAPLRIIIEDGRGGVRSTATVAPQQIGRPSPFGATSRPGTRVSVPGGAGRSYPA